MTRKREPGRRHYGGRAKRPALPSYLLPAPVTTVQVSPSLLTAAEVARKAGQADGGHSSAA